MDIFAGNEQVIGHQTNCQGVMGSGIAKIVKEKFPTCYEEYHSLCNSYENKEDLLGKCQLQRLFHRNGFLSSPRGHRMCLCRRYQALVCRAC